MICIIYLFTYANFLLFITSYHIFLYSCLLCHALCYLFLPIIYFSTDRLVSTKSGTVIMNAIDPAKVKYTTLLR